MLLVGSNRAGLVVNSNVRGRPIISGGTVRTDTGQILRLARSRESDPATKTTAMWQAIRALGCNGARVGFDLGTRPLSALFANLDAIVAAARNNRGYVMLCNTYFAPGTFDDAITANRNTLMEQWPPIAARYAGEPHVFFETLNEPDAVGWGRYDQYGSTANVPTKLLIAVRDVYNVIRANAPDSLVLMPSPANLLANGGAQQYIHAIKALENIGPVDWSKTAWSFHYYNKSFVLGVTNITATDGGRAGIRWLADRFPLICTETNWWMETNRRPLIDGLDALEDIKIAWSLMTAPGATTPKPDPIDPSKTIEEEWPPEIALYTGDGYLIRKVNQLRGRGFVIPVE